MFYKRPKKHKIYDKKRKTFRKAYYTKQRVLDGFSNVSELLTNKGEKRC